MNELSENSGYERIIEQSFGLIHSNDTDPKKSNRLFISNNFNKVAIPQLGALDQDILFGILKKVSETNNPYCILNYKEIKEILGRTNKSKKELIGVFDIFSRRVFDINFWFSCRAEKFDDKKRLYIDESKGVIRIFTKLIVHDIKKEVVRKGETVYETVFNYLEIALNSEVFSLLRGMNENFLVLLMPEFYALKSKYSKILYRLLNQFKSTGLLVMKWDEFLSQFGANEGIYKANTSNINKYILDVAIKELCNPETFKDLGIKDENGEIIQNYIPFKNLECTKKKIGRKIAHIEFKFDPVLKSKNDENLPVNKENIENVGSTDSQK